MQDLFSKVENIELKVKQVVAKLDMLKNENAYLKEENKNLTEKLKQQKGIIKELEIKSNDIQPESLEKWNEEKAALKNDIDNQITEVNKVIEILKTQ